MGLQEFNFITRETAQRLELLLSQTPGPRFEQRPSRGGARGRDPLLVRCTSVTPVGGSDVGNEAYPAVALAIHASETAADQPELGTMWLTLIGDGPSAVAPTLDAVYYGMISGTFDPDPGGAGTDERHRVFAVAPAGASAAFASATLGTSFTISSGGPHDVTAMTLSIPAAGDYLITVAATGAITPSAANQSYNLRVEVYDNTASAVITGGETTFGSCALDATNHIVAITYTDSGAIITTAHFTSARTLKLRANYAGSAPTTARLDIATTMSFVKIG